MAAKIKIEMQTPDETDLVHTLPSIDDHPEVGKPTHAPAEVQAANAVNATKKKTLKDVAPKEDFPLHGPTNTPIAAFMNQPLGVKKAMATASEALRARGHHVLAGGVDLASKALPDSPFEVANAGLMGYGARQAMRGAGAPEGSESPDVSDSAPASGVSEAPTPPPAPKLPMPEPLPSIEDQYHAAQQDPRTPGGPGTPTGQAPIVSPSPAPPAFENKTPNRAKIDAIKKGTVAGVAGAGVAATTGTAEGSTPDYDQKEQGLMQSMSALGHPIMKVSGDRTAEQQAALFAKGPGVTQKSGVPGDESRHQLGMAGDFAFVGPDGKPDFSPDLPWDTLGRMAKIHGFEWGGDFKTLKDMGHVQLPLGAGAPGAQGTPATGAAPTGPTPGIKVEPMDAGDHKEAKSLPMWRQVMDPLMEQAPFITGATGGMLAGTAALPTAAVSGPFGPAVAAAGGAYTGGLVGDAIRQTYRHLTGQDLDQTASQRMDTMSAAGRSQMYQEMVGQGFQAYMAARALGSRAGGSLQALNTSGKYGLNLSAADMSTSSLARGASRVMNYISQTARTVTDTAREAGESNAVKAVRDALDKLTTFHSNMETGTEIQAGIKAGIKGMKEGPVGSLYQAAKKAGPDVDLRPLIADLTATFNKEGTPQSARNAILKLFPEAIDPATGEITALVGTDPYTVSFEQAAKLRTRLGLRGRKALESIGTDATSLATKLYGDLSETLGKLSPNFAAASGEYNKARQDIANRVITATMKSSPDKIVSALGGTPSVQTVDALRNTMLKHAQSSGVDTTEALTGMQGFQALRRSWFDQFILKNKAGAFDPAGMAERMAKANGALQGFFGFNKYDTEGIAAVQMAKDIATALQRRVPIPSGSAANWARAGELTGLVTTALKYGMGASAVQVGTEEVLPGFITWAMHRPTVAKMFIQGLQNQTSVKGASLMGRALGAYFASGGPDADPEPDANDPENMPPYDPNAPTPGATPGAKGTSGQVDPKIIGMGSGVGIGGDEQPQPQASTDPMTGAPINVHTYDPTAVPEAPGGGVAPYPSTPRSQIRPELQPKPRTLGAGATKISAAPMDALSPPSDEDPIKPVTQVVHAIGNKIRAQGKSLAAAAGAGSEDPTSASLGASMQGGAEGLAAWVEDQFTPENIAMSMVPLHEITELEQLTRELGRSAEGLPGFYSRLTRAVEGVQELGKKASSVPGMVSPAKVLEAIKQANPDEVEWKQIIPFLRERGNNPIPKAEILNFLNERKFQLKSVTSGEELSPTPYQLGEKVPFAPNPGGERPPGYSMDVHDPTPGYYGGNIGEASIRHNGEKWVAEVPSRINSGLPTDYTAPEGSKSADSWSNLASFDTQAQAEAWMHARIEAAAPVRDNPSFWESYSTPGMTGDEDARINYRENRVSMPGYDPATGQGNKGIAPKGFRAPVHKYPEHNILATGRYQDMELPTHMVEGVPAPEDTGVEFRPPKSRSLPEPEYDENGDLIPLEEPSYWAEDHPTLEDLTPGMGSEETARLRKPIKGVMTEEVQSDIHQEADRVYREMLDKARQKEAARLADKENIPEKEALNRIPKNAFARAHWEIKRPDGTVMERYMTEADARHDLDARNYQRPADVHFTLEKSKGIPEHVGYQQMRTDNPQVMALQDHVKTAEESKNAAYAAYQKVKQQREDFILKYRDEEAKKLGYENFSALEDDRYAYDDDREIREQKRQKSRESYSQIVLNEDKAPEAVAMQNQVDQLQETHSDTEKALAEARERLTSLGMRTGDWGLTKPHQKPVPQAPFKKEADWTLLELKTQLLRHAAETKGEETFFGHIGGGEHADRYDLRTLASKLEWDPDRNKLVVYDKDGDEWKALDIGAPTKDNLQSHIGDEAGERLYDKIEEHKQTGGYDDTDEMAQEDEDDSGLPGTQEQRDAADQSDLEYGEQREAEWYEQQHTIEQFDEPVLDEHGDPALDADGDPETNSMYRLFEDDNFDSDDPDTWETFDTRRQAERALQRRVEDHMESYEHDYDPDRYDHLKEMKKERQKRYPSIDTKDLPVGGQGMARFYDESLKSRIERLLSRFGGGEMHKIEVPSGAKPGTMAYAWVTKLTPEMKQKILAAGMDLMAVALAVKASTAPQSVKDTVMAAARKDTLDKRRSRSRPQSQSQSQSQSLQPQ